MTRIHADSETSVLRPTRRLSAKESKVFDRIRRDFVHLAPSDAEMMTAYAETVIRYQDAAKEAKRSPTLTVQTFNKATGNPTGTKIVRNPALTTVKEAQAQMNALARRLMIDAASGEKRQRLLTKKARALAASEHAQATDIDARTSFSEEQIIETMHELERRVTLRGEALRNAALDQLRVRQDIADIYTDPECAYLFEERNTCC